MIHHKARQSNGGQRRAAHGHRKHHGKAPVAELDGGVLFQAVGQCGGTNEEQQQPPRHEQQHLVGAGVLYPGKQHKTHQQLCPCKAGRAGRRRFAANHSPIPMRMKFSKPMRSVCAASSSVMPPKL